MKKGFIRLEIPSGYREQSLRDGRFLWLSREESDSPGRLLSAEAPTAAGLMKLATQRAFPPGVSGRFRRLPEFQRRLDFY